MEKRIFISEQSKVVTKREGDTNVYFIAIPGDATHFKKHVLNENNGIKIDENGMHVYEELTSVLFKVRYVEEDKLQTVTYDDLDRAINGVTRVSDNEVYEVDLSLLPLPTIVLKNFNNTKELQDWLVGYYLQTVLNEGKDYGVEKWIEKI